MTSPNLDALVSSVAKIIGQEIGRDKVHIDLIDTAVRSLDKKRRFDTEPFPWPPWPQNSDEKEVAQGFAEAFAKLDDRLARLEQRRSKDAPVLFERAVHGEQVEFSEWKAQLTHWRKRLEAFANWPLSKSKKEAEAGKLLGGLAPDQQSKRLAPIRRGRPNASLTFKHDAAAAAAGILRGHNLCPKLGKKSLFVEVATILASDNAYHQCRKFLEARKPVSN